MASIAQIVQQHNNPDASETLLYGRCVLCVVTIVIVVIVVFH